MRRRQATALETYVTTAAAQLGELSWHESQQRIPTASRSPPSLSVSLSCLSTHRLADVVPKIGRQEMVLADLVGNW